MAAFMTQPQISSRCVDGDLLTTNQLYDLTIYYCLLLILKVETLQGKKIQITPKYTDTVTGFDNENTLF